MRHSSTHKYWLYSLLCVHISSLLSVCPVPWALGAPVDRRGASGGCSSGCTCQHRYLEVKRKSCGSVGEQSSFPFPTTVNVPPPLLSHYGLGCCSSTGIAGASQCLRLLVILESCQRLSWHRQWKDNCNFFLTAFTSMKAEGNFLGQRKGTSVAQGCSSCSASQTCCMQQTWEGFSKAFIAENGRQAKWLPAPLYGNAYRWESVYICKAICIKEGVFMEIDWRRRQGIEKRNFLIGRTFFYLFFKNFSHKTPVFWERY